MGRTITILAAAVVAAAASSLVAAPAWAWCQLTTCKGSNCGQDADSDGCPTKGHKLKWAGTCVGFSLQKRGTQNLDNAKVRDAVKKAFAAWSEVDCGNGEVASLNLGALIDTLCVANAYDAEGPNVNAVIFRDDKFEYTGLHTNNTLAKAVPHFDANTGEILDADIEVNTANTHFTLGSDNIDYDLQTVLTHEVGHFLGLAHSSNPDAVMYASYQKGTLTGRVLTDDDKAAICAIYPPKRKGTCSLTPRGGLDLCDGRTEPAGLCRARPAANATAWLPVALACAVIVGRRGWRKEPAA
jgi:hypothetical protein